MHSADTRWWVMQCHRTHLLWSLSPCTQHTSFISGELFWMKSWQSAMTLLRGSTPIRVSQAWSGASSSWHADEGARYVELEHRASKTHEQQTKQQNHASRDNGVS